MKTTAMGAKHRFGLQKPIITLVFAWVLLSGSLGSATTIKLDFNQDGVLPSSQGFSYRGRYSSLPESAFFSVSGGLLHMNTFGSGPWTVAGYEIFDVFDPNQDFFVELRMKVFQGTGPFGMLFEVSDNVSDFEFSFADDGIYMPPPRPFESFDTTDGFHTYRVVSPGGSAAYQLFIDDVLFYIGNVIPGGDPANRFAFGDITTGAEGRADIDYITYRQTPVPEPATMLLLGTGLVGLAGFRRKFRK